MNLEPQHYISLGVAIVAFVVWLVRLEGRVNSLKERCGVLERDLTAAETKASVQADAHRSTSDALIRVEEALKHLTRMVEQQIVATQPVKTTRRPAS